MTILLPVNETGILPYNKDDIVDMTNVESEADFPQAENKSGIYILPVEWTVYSTIAVEADNLADAIGRARKNMHSLPLSSCEYREDSYTIPSDDEEYIMSCASSARRISNVVLHKDGTVTNE